jgi:hypothetical protein
MRVVISVCMLLLPISALAQDRKEMDEAAAKAIESIKGQIKTTRCWAKFGEYVLWGLAMLGEGSTPSEGNYAEDLKSCVDYIMTGRNPYPDTVNWFAPISLLFLAEVYKKDPKDEIKTKMQELVKSIEEVLESTGGWSHKKGFTYNLAGKIVPDIAMLTGVCVAALGDARNCGCEVSNAVLQRAMAHCQKISDGQGLIYGTNNDSTPDNGNTRIGLVMLGLHLMGQKNEIYAKAAKGLSARISSGVGCWLTGQFAAFKSEWIPKMLQRRESDGSIWLWHTENLNYEKNEFGCNTFSTGVMAVVLQLEKGHLFEPMAAKKDGKPGGPSSAPDKPKSPFSQKK